MGDGCFPSFSQQRLLLAVYLAHIKLGDGSRLAHWAKVRYSGELAYALLCQHLLHPQLPDELMLAAHQASEDLRARLPRGCSWEAAQAQAIRVLPVALRVLSVLNAPVLRPQRV
ncbi:MAG: hypothetical protein EOO63_14625 [Hymenobacter sp.]|nr:MAG: hypothetical protein EOO63_14625 [Hymenobacter sp.]